MSFETIKGKYTTIFNYLKTDLIKKQRSFKIGLISIYLVVFFLTFLMNAISLSPLIFIRLSEDQVGEADLVFLPKLTTIDVSSSSTTFDTTFIKNNSLIQNPFNVKFLDFDDLNNRLKNVSFLTGLSPRWIIRGNSTYTSKTKSNWAVSNVFIIDSNLENKQGMGRQLHLPIIYLNECYVSESLFKSLQMDLKDDNIIQLNVKLSGLMKAIGQGQQMSSAQDSFGNINQGGRQFDYDDDNHKEKKPPREDEINDTPSLEDLEKKNLKEFIKSILPQTININKQMLLSILGVSHLPSNITISLSLFKSPLLSNIIFIRMIKDFIEDNKEIFNQFFDVDEVNNKVRLKEIDDSFAFPIDVYKIVDLFEDKELDEITSFKLNLTVKSIVKQTSGKWPSSSGNVIAIDAKYMKYYIKDNLMRIAAIITKKYNYTMLDSYINGNLMKGLANFNINKYALTVNAIINNKFNIYSNTQTDVRRLLSKYTKQITEALGFDYPISITMPVYSSFRLIEIGKCFLEDIFIAIMIFLWMLSVLLIYSLMLGNVDERTYEFGMLRSLGFIKDNLKEMILIQGLLFAFPGIILGLMTSYIVNSYIGFLLNWYSGIIIPYNLNTSTIIFGVCIGISIPLASSYFPIKKALNANLKEALTIFNKKVGDLVVSMVKLENYGISLSSFLSSCVIISIGFATYYLAPLSFILMNPKIFLLIFTLILMLLILGLIIILQMFIPSIQRILLKIMMFIVKRDRNINILIVKNLEGHGRKNKKVSIMFMIGVGFIIFAGCTLNLIISFVTNIAKSAMGGDINIWLFSEEASSLNEILLKSYLNQTMQKFPNLIYSYSFASHYLDLIINRDTKIGALNGYPSQERPIMSVDANFVRSAFQNLYRVSEYDTTLNYTINEQSNKVDIISMLYINENIPKIFKSNTQLNFPINPYYGGFSYNSQLNLIAAEGIRKSSAIGINNPCSATINTQFIQKIPCKVVAMAAKLPGIPLISSYKSLSYFSPVIISLNQMREIVENEGNIYPSIKYLLSKTNVNKNTIDGIPKAGMILKFYDNAPKTLKEMVYFELKNLIKDDGPMSFFIEEINETADKVAIVMEYILLILGIIALVLSFFLIWTSFYGNIKENIGEFGIIRAIGVTSAQASRMYLYEAACILLSSIITGTFIGVLVAVSLSLQFNMFVELPFEFNFPYKLYFILVSFGLIMGMIGSYYPIVEVNQMSLISIMKGFSEEN